MRSIRFSGHANAVLSDPLRKLRDGRSIQGAHLSGPFKVSILVKPSATPVCSADRRFGVAKAARIAFGLKMVVRSRQDMVLYSSAVKNCSSFIRRTTASSSCAAGTPSATLWSNVRLKMQVWPTVSAASRTTGRSAIRPMPRMTD